MKKEGQSSSKGKGFFTICGRREGSERGDGPQSIATKLKSNERDFSRSFAGWRWSSLSQDSFWLQNIPLTLGLTYRKTQSLTLSSWWKPASEISRQDASGKQKMERKKETPCTGVWECLLSNIPERRWELKTSNKMFAPSHLANFSYLGSWLWFIPKAVNCWGGRRGGKWT